LQIILPRLDAMIAEAEHHTHSNPLLLSSWSSCIAVLLVDDYAPWRLRRRRSCATWLHYKNNFNHVCFVPASLQTLIGDTYLKISLNAKSNLEVIYRKILLNTKSKMNESPFQSSSPPASRLT